METREPSNLRKILIGGMTSLVSGFAILSYTIAQHEPVRRSLDEKPSSFYSFQKEAYKEADKNKDGSLNEEETRTYENKMKSYLGRF